MNHGQKRFASVAILAISLLAPLGARAQSSAPGAAAAAAGSPLTPDLLAKMLTLVSTKGHDGKIAPRFANGLGLTAAGQTWIDREAQAANAAGDHYIDVGQGPDSEILLTLRTPKAVTAYRVRRDGELLSALSVDIATHALTMSSPADAQADFAAECAFWTQNIDGFLAQK